MMQSEEAFEYSKKGRVSYMIDTGNAKSKEEVVAEDGDLCAKGWIMIL